MWERHRLQVNWHRRLKDDMHALENGWNKRLFKQTFLWKLDLAWYDYPGRYNQRSWKSQRKTQYKGS